MKFLRFFVLGVCLFMGVGCDRFGDANTSGPTPNVHCDNESVGNTTIKVVCPGAQE